MILRIVLLLVAAASLAVAVPVTLRQDLSGPDSAHPVRWDFFCSEGDNAGKWTTIPVPSCWEMHGFGRLHYGKNEAHFGPVRGEYRHRFSVPAAWKDRRVFLVCDGVMTDAAIRINGKSAGPVHQGAFYRFESEITDLLRPGADNLLEMTVTDKSANASVNRAEREADYWVFGGVFRPVWLKAVPEQFIDRVAIDARADGRFAMEVFLRGDGNADTIETEVFAADGRSLGPPLETPLAARWITAKFPDPAPWNSETPNLHTVVVRLKRGAEVRHEIRQRFGFRTVEVRPGEGIFVNGRRLLLKGVNRHSFWPTTGRSLDEKVHRDDIALMKAMNMNAVRMAHYPPDERFLELCDEEGLYVVDELGGWQKFYDTDVGRARVHEMLARDVNHPSIVMWANGNEGGFNFDLDELFLRLDPQRRPVLHPWAKFGAINTEHYPTYRELRALLASGDVALPTEFLHGLYDGGHGASLEDFWEAIRTAKTGGGGFLWALTDEGVQVPGADHIDVQGNWAPDGIVGPFRQKEGSFYTIQDIWSPIQFPRALPEDFTGSLPVENRYDFTDLATCRFQWQLRDFDAEPGFTVVAEGEVVTGSVPPGGHEKLDLPLPADFRRADALAVTARDAKGREVRNWVWPLRSPAEFTSALVSSTRAVEPTVHGDEREFRAGDVTLRVSATDGRLIALRVGDRVMPLTSGPIREARWSLDASGWIRLDYAVAGNQPPAKEIGIAFEFPEDQMLAKTWLGAGPFRVWRNRLRGPNFGVWQTERNATIAGAAVWDYPEFAGYFADVRWLRLATTAGDLTLVVPDAGTFVRVGTPRQAEVKYLAHTAMTFPSGNLAVLRDLPPIGTKFHPAKEMGPQCVDPIVTAPYRGTIYLRVDGR